MKRIALATLVLPLTHANAQIVPPRPGVDMPQAYYDRIADDPGAFRFEKAWIEKARRAKEAREAYLRKHPRTGPMSMASMAAVYLYKLTAGRNYTAVKKLTLLKLVLHTIIAVGITPTATDASSESWPQLAAMYALLSREG